MKMAREIKTSRAGGKKVETYVSEGLKAKLRKHCKRTNTSQAQFVRDLIQGALKTVRVR